MLTSKTFKTLAKALQTSRPDPAATLLGSLDPDAEWMLVQWELDVKAVADVCAASNPRFDRERFIQACYA
jgi:hypothetical protein